MSTWITDARTFAAARESKEPEEARRAELGRQIVEAATSRRAEGTWCSAIRCIARAGRKACSGWITVAQTEAGRVEWSCPACQDHGVITGFEGTEIDLSSYVPRAKKARMWGFDEEERAELLAGTSHIPALRAVVARASPSTEIKGFLMVQATLDELDEVYTLVEHLTDMTRSRRKIELLDGLRASLCSVMDGF